MWKLTIFWILLTNNATDMYLILDDPCLILGKSASFTKVFLLMKTHFIAYFPYLMVNFLTVSPLFWNAVCRGPFSTQKDEFSHCCIEANENESRESWSIWSLFRKKIRVSQWGSSIFEVLHANCFDISNLTWILTTLL